MMFSVAYAAGAPWNDSKWEHEKFNKLPVAARAKLTIPYAAGCPPKCRKSEKMKAVS